MTEQNKSPETEQPEHIQDDHVPADDARSASDGYDMIIQVQERDMFAEWNDARRPGSSRTNGPVYVPHSPQAGPLAQDAAAQQKSVASRYTGQQIEAATRAAFSHWREVDQDQVTAKVVPEPGVFLPHDLVGIAHALMAADAAASKPVREQAERIAAEMDEYADGYAESGANGLRLANFLTESAAFIRAILAPQSPAEPETVLLTDGNFVRTDVFITGIDDRKPRANTSEDQS